MPLIWSTVNAHIKQVWGSANEQSILPAVYLCRCVNGQGPGINVKTSSGVVTVLPRAISTRHRVSYAISQGLLDMIGCATIRITPTEASVCFKSICILPVESCISSHSTLLSRSLFAQVGCQTLYREPTMISGIVEDFPLWANNYSRDNEDEKS